MVAMTTTILPCGCTGPGSGFAYQDRLYGTGNRAHNMTAKEGQHPTYRCTLCSKERGASATTQEAKKQKKKGDEDAAPKKNSRRG